LLSALRTQVVGDAKRRSWVVTGVTDVAVSGNTGEDDQAWVFII